MTKPISIQSPETLCRLWIHEASRIFYDRLINDEDRTWFKDLIMELLQRIFRIPMEAD
jgi:dynein heavy chain